ncbi:VOC family protein [Flavobacterium sp. RHBU_3]|uniref:VOC family protein n=1 Tax=Flavobacterium sp. RHBU_3 TaxID=3391184 RepID=UPI003984F872
MTKTPNVIGSAPILAVTDVQETVNYYIEKLGFELIATLLQPPVYGMVQRNGFQVHFGKTEVHTPNSKHRNDLPDFILWIPEIDAFYNEIKQRGATIITEIALRPYGSREFTIEDNNGYRILIDD